MSRTWMTALKGHTGKSGFWDRLSLTRKRGFRTVCGPAASQFQGSDKVDTGIEDKRKDWGTSAACPIA
jgi:hypothetical protein